MALLYETTRENRTLRIEKTDRAETPFLLTLTVQKLGMTTSVYYFISHEEVLGITEALEEGATVPD
jgi:hypothetical protein